MSGIETIRKLLPRLLHDRKLQRRIAGGLGILSGMGVGLAGYALLHEPVAIELERLTLRLPNAKGRLPHNGLKILHLSDTHFQNFGWRERTKIERVRRLTAELEYDLLVHTGDFWHNEAGIENISTLLNLLPKPRLGAFGVLGNHDYVCYSHSDILLRNWERYQQQNRNGVWGAGGAATNGTNGHAPSNGALPLGQLNGLVADRANGQAHGASSMHDAHKGVATTSTSWLEFAQNSLQFLRYFMNVPFDLERVSLNNVRLLIEMLDQHGIQILHNRSIHLCYHPGEPDGVDLHLAGVDDVSEGVVDLASAWSDVPDDSLKILLSHNPDILEDPASRRADLILSGHTHGGQVSLPLLGAAHTQSIHLGRREAAGYMRRGQTHVYVTRGIGEGIPLRFGAKPQITLLTILAE